MKIINLAAASSVVKTQTQFSAEAPTMLFIKEKTTMEIDEHYTIDSQNICQRKAT